MDVPGLADVNVRKQARDAIHAALNRKGESFKILFLINLLSGRIVDQDATTMHMVLDSTPDITVQYGVIFNRLSRKVMKDVDDKGVPDQIMASLITSSDGKQRPKPDVWWFPHIDELEDEENKIVMLPRHDEFVRWIWEKVP